MQDDFGLLRSHTPRFRESIPAAPPPPTLVNWLAASLYTVCTVGFGIWLFDLHTRTVGPNELVDYYGFTVIFGSMALLALGMGWGAWRFRSAPGPLAVRAWRGVPLLVHAGIASAMGVLMVWDPRYSDEQPAIEVVSQAVLKAAVAAVFLGWVPGLVLHGVARRTGVLLGAGPIGAAWLGSLAIAFG